MKKDALSSASLSSASLSSARSDSFLDRNLTRERREFTKDLLFLKTEDWLLDRIYISPVLLFA